MEDRVPAVKQIMMGHLEGSQQSPGQHQAGKPLYRACVECNGEQGLEKSGGFFGSRVTWEERP